MANCITELLAERPVLTDGAWGTEFQALGLDNGACPDAWNLSHPGRVTRVAAAYVAAGSRVILTNTFGANRFRLAEYGLADQVAEINRAGVALSLAAAGEQALVFASMGSSGKMLMMGDVTEDELHAAFTVQAEAMAAAGAHAIVAETVADLAEGEIMVAAAAATGLPVVASICFDAGKDLDRTMMGDTPERAAERMLAAGATLLGANCGQSIATYAGICQRLAAAAGGPVWIKPNAGLPKVVGGETVYDSDAAGWAGCVPAIVAAGAGFIGGCCGTSPAFIAAAAKVLASL